MCVKAAAISGRLTHLRSPITGLQQSVPPTPGSGLRLANRNASGKYRLDQFF
jgi:hypothetical protein